MYSFKFDEALQHKTLFFNFEKQNIALPGPRVFCVLKDWNQPKLSKDRNIQDNMLPCNFMYYLLYFV
jgi:hypothetical protein